MTALLAGSGFCHGADEPMTLDLAPFYWERFVTPQRTNSEMATVAGRQIFDGLPFQVDGRACLYGQALAHQRGRPASAYPDIRGVKVGRTFDELHLLHATQFTDREGVVVAKVRLNYTDGTSHEFPIAYGGQVRDWQRLQSEAREIYTDANTKVIWRGPGVARFKSTTRMSKTRLMNPFPDKVVTTMDFVSTGQVAAYDVAAATVARSDPKRPVTPPVPLDRPERKFDGGLIVRVVDESDQPIEGVLVGPNLSVAGSPSATVTTPLYTTADGMGTVNYPRNESACIYFTVHKDGWHRASGNDWLWFSQVARGTNGIMATIRMTRDVPIAKGTNAVGAGISSAPTGSGAASVGPDSRRYPILMIDYPAGSNVRVEYVNSLTPPLVWEALTVITNLPYSPYAFICGREVGAGAQRFYRAVPLP
jgi:hypothetical protein